MKNQDLVRNPIFKLVGIVLILYFTLFANKHDNRSLSRRYSSDNIKKSIDEVAKKKKEIEEKIYKAKKLKEELNQTQNLNETK